MNKKPKPFDVISQATLRDSDLLRAMIETLELYRPVKYKDLISEGNEVLEKFGDFGYVSYLYRSGEASTGFDDILWLINEDLYDAMQDISPAGCCYGSHPGDGALFGFWPFEDSELWE